MTMLASILESFRQTAQSEREKGNYFERLVKVYLLNEPYYADLYAGKVWLWEDWRREWMRRFNADPGGDAGIDLVAETTGGEFHAIQAKFYAATAKLRLEDFSTYFTASSKKHFARRLIVLTATESTHHLREAVKDQYPPVNLITLFELENSRIEWASFQPQLDTVKLRAVKKLRPDQELAVTNAAKGLIRADRGKLIMACGTGKTFTALRLAEKVAGQGGHVLFLVPSLNLLSQTLTEWTQEALIPLHSYAVCSDRDVGKKRQTNIDDFVMLSHELQYPATTEPDKLASEIGKRHDDDHISVVFSTYHSIDVISKAQLAHGLCKFDLVVCDEAHRTTGATFGNDDESAFVKVHDAAYILAGKRLYMTATPRIYGDHVKASAEKDNVALCSMDDEALYGQELYVLTFSEAVRRGLLVDYKVVVLAVEEAHVSRRLQDLLKDENNQLKVDDAAKIVGCWKALSKQGLTNELAGDGDPMRRAVAFCQVIETTKAGKTHRVSSKQIAGMFRAVVKAYQAQEEESEQVAQLACEAEHIDGSMNAGEKDAKLAWLKAQAPKDTCRILSNVRCLSEGVDVPALDAVLFLTPRNSAVDVVQSVGRVMRNSAGKQRGYVILPVVIPAGVQPHEALNDNKTYTVVWQVLQALRSHDDRFDAMVNKLELIGKDTRKMEVIAITDKLQRKQEKASGATNKDAGKGQFHIGEAVKRPIKEDQKELQFEIGEIERAVYAKLVQKVGNRHHWEEWANDIAKIARTHFDRIKGILENPNNGKERGAFNALAAELRDDLNDSIGDDDIVEMLAQHLITKPVFDALFEGYSFAEHNPMSLAMQKVLDTLHEHHLEKEADTLQSFYDSVKMRAEGIDNAAGKQKIVAELYKKFFRNAFPKMAERLSIVYTPVEVVDFIIHSVGHILQTEFSQTLGSKAVHIIDPFTGTGTFITRLLQSGLITPEELPHKYRNEIHANEMVLLAYYIAAINIEATYHGIVSGEYQPFEGICLTDTFQLYEKEDMIDALLDKNSARRRRQKKLDIRVIIGNPPYSVGQKSISDNNLKVSYPILDTRIRDTYGSSSRITKRKSLYDNYIRAFRWASDRIVDGGVIAFISNGGFVDKSTMDGMRKTLVNEFSDIYVVNLRGDIRKNMLSKGSAMEGENIFDSGSMTGIAITFLVKNPLKKKTTDVFYHDIGNALSRDEKLDALKRLGSLYQMKKNSLLSPLVPDEHGDWLRQRDTSFSEHFIIGDKRNREPSIFESYSFGAETKRDAWCYNASRNELISNISRMIDFYNTEVFRFDSLNGELIKADRADKALGSISSDKTKIKWSENLIRDLVVKKTRTFEKSSLRTSLYRPFSKEWLYYNKELNWSRYRLPKIFPTSKDNNILMCISGVGARSGFTALMADYIPAFDFIEKGQCFPLYLYETDESGAKIPEKKSGELFTGSTNIEPKRRHALTDEGLGHFRAAYPSEDIGKEDLFYYIYGLLHSPDYRQSYADNLSKELPRIPRVETASDFWAFSQAGRALAELHLNYESVEPYPVKLVCGDQILEDADYRVDKMRYGKNGKDKDLTTLIYNDKITLTGIPLEAYGYVVNGKPALDWVVERQRIKADKDSGIINDANDWAIETMGNPRYPLELFQRVVTVSLKTLAIVYNLPPLRELN